MGLSAGLHGWWRMLPARACDALSATKLAPRNLLFCRNAGCNTAVAAAVAQTLRVLLLLHLNQCLQEKCHAPELLLVWLFQIGPARLLIAAAVLAGARLVYNLDPGFSAVYLLLAMIAAIYINLGTKQEGEASAYSVFNPGVRRLPGQLDADEIDRQIRQGQM
jgi:hypothetical protein